MQISQKGMNPHAWPGWLLRSKAEKIHRFISYFKFLFKCLNINQQIGRTQFVLARTLFSWVVGYTSLEIHGVNLFFFRVSRGNLARQTMSARWEITMNASTSD